MKSKDQLYDFMNSYGLGVLSSIKDDGSPSAAIVGFGQTKELNILFGTSNISQKYNNLKANPKVAFTIGGNSAETIQLEGLARELTDDELNLVRNNYWTKNPRAEAHHKIQTKNTLLLQLPGFVSPTFALIPGI
jgi:general stress protein 26